MAPCIVVIVENLLINISCDGTTITDTLQCTCRQMRMLLYHPAGQSNDDVQVQTYDVVPISPSLGMVAFVPGTKPLKAVMTDPALVPEASVAAADAAFSKFITAKGSGCQNVGESQLIVIARPDLMILMPQCNRRVESGPNSFTKLGMQHSMTVVSLLVLGA